MSLSNVPLYSATENVCDIEDIISDYRSNAVPILKENEIVHIRQVLLEWYKLNRRQLPWRGDQSNDYPSLTPSRSAYGTWISEIMLQQTRVETVIPYWFRWLEKFPTIQDLATATPDEVNTLWAGLGYYRRGQMLLKGAKQIMKDNNGIIPDTVKGLLEVPGIGPYTAGAISSIAFNKVEHLVDGNVIRVFSRLQAIKNDTSTGLEKICWALAKQLIHPTFPGDFNQALMDLGATICKPTSPLCTECPLQTVCHANILCNISNTTNKAFDTKDKTISSDGINNLLTLPTSVTSFPYKIEKTKPKEYLFSVGVISRALSTNSGREDWYFLFIRRPDNGLLARQWEFPSVILPPHTDSQKSRDEGAEVMLPEVSDESLWGPLLVFLEEDVGLSLSKDGATSTPMQGPKEPIVHVFSHQRHTMFLTMRHMVSETHFDGSTAWTSHCSQKREVKWMTLKEVENLGVTTGVKKIIAAIRKTATSTSGETNSTNSIPALARSKSTTTSKTSKKRNTNKVSVIESDAMDDVVSCITKSSPMSKSSKRSRKSDFDSSTSNDSQSKLRKQKSILDFTHEKK